MRKIMKKDILMFGSLLSLMSVSGAALAQNCTSPTRCAELGYKKSASDCDGMESLVCPFDSSKYFCVEAGDSAAGDQPGMILYSDGSISNDVVSGKTAVGVVAYVDKNRRFAVALEESSSTLEWSTPSYENLSCLTDYSNQADAQTDFKGADNTSCIVNYNSSNHHPAAEYCNSYKPVSSGTGSSGWYLPGAGELYAISSNHEAINFGLQKLSKTRLQNDYYWSSSEYTSDSYYAWVVYLSDGSMASRSIKNYKRRVRCVLAF